MSTVSIKGLSKADVLRVLYDNARPLGLGILHYREENMTKAEAEALLVGSNYFDYLHGRVMKISMKNDEEISTGLYDRDNGEGVGARAIETLR